MKKKKSKNKIEIDKIIDKMSPYGVPALVLLVMLSLAPCSGGAAIMWALAALGGPFGALIGIGVLVFLGKNGDKISKFGYEKSIRILLNKWIDEGQSINGIKKKISNYPISKKLKEVIYEYLNRFEKPNPEPIKIKGELFSELKKWRSKEAQKKMQSAFIIFHNRTLEMIEESVDQINKKEDLLEIRGIGQVKYEAYGDELWEIILAYKEVKRN